MPFKFLPRDRSVQSGVRRIAKEQVDNILARLDRDLAADPVAVHAIRKSSKMLRGLLRLIRPVCATARAEEAALRDAARQIADLRDADVMRRTFESLAEALPEPARAPARAALDARVTGAMPAHRLDGGNHDLRAEFSDMRHRCREWMIDGQEFEALEPGLTATWRQARKGLRLAREAFADDGLPPAPFHEWRKRVKRHWYQARLLEPVWPPMMAPHIAQADALGELLGDHNDLDVLLTTLETEPEPALEGVLEPLRTEILRRRRLLARDAVALGERLFAERADALAERWGRWWCLWRG